MRPVRFSRDVVFDLSSSEAKQVPIFIDHDTSGHGLVGHADTTHDGRSLSANGVVSAATESARIVVDSAKKGFQWQASIGATIKSKKFIEAGKSVMVNGRLQDGPFDLIKGQHHEISFVPIGADSTTSAQIAAEAEARSKKMAQADAATEVVDDVQEVIATVKDHEEDSDFSEWLEAQGFDLDNLAERSKVALEAAYKVEKERQDDKFSDNYIRKSRKKMGDEVARWRKINELTAEFPAIREEAMREGWDAATTELAVVKAELGRAPKTTFSARRDVDGGVLECALLMDAPGVEPEWLDKKSDHWFKFKSQYGGFSEETIDAATSSSLRDLSISALFDIYLSANQVSMQPGSTVQSKFTAVQDCRRKLQATSGFSTIDISGILSNVMGKSMLAAFTSQNNAAQRMSSTRSVRDFKETKAFRLTGNGDFLPVGPTGELQLMQLQEEEFANRAITYGRLLALSRDILINDDLGALTSATQILGRKAAVKLQREFFTLWNNLQTGSAFFSAGNKNLATTNPLGIVGLTAAELLFMDQEDQDEDPIDMDPALLVVPSDLKVKAEELMTGTQTIMFARDTSAATANQVPDINTHAGKFEILSTTWLKRTEIPGNSTTSWYLLANPNELAAAEIVYLNGRQTPFIEGDDSDFQLLGFQWRSYFDFGVAQQDTRAAVKSTI